jgi:hypothetical protein
MLVAAFLFGTLIGELQDIFYSINKTAREIESHIEEVSSFLISNRFQMYFLFHTSCFVESLRGVLPLCVNIVVQSIWTAPAQDKRLDQIQVLK